MLGVDQEAWLADGLTASRARWNIIAQQTLMAQSSQLKIAMPDDGRIWTDGWDGYPVARTRLFEALRASGAANSLVLGGDVHTFYATDLRRDFDRPVSSANPLIATEFCGTSITSGSRPQQRTLAYLDINPHIHYGRSDKRGFMLMEVTPSATTTHFMGLDEVRDAASKVATLASFEVADGRPGGRRIA
jgi:alkaline phosphatase D